MTRERSDSLMLEWRERFSRDPVAARVVSRLRHRRDEIWRGTFELLRRESPEYRNAIDADFAGESKAHCGELLSTIIAIAEGAGDARGGDPFAFVRDHAAWRARHRVPLIASLHAYRLAHRTYWGLTREALQQHAPQDEALAALSTLTDFWIELFDHVGAVLTEAHAVEEPLILAQNSTAYRQLIDDLLSGSAPRDDAASSSR